MLSTPTELRWPLPIAPYTVALLKPKAGSKEEVAASSMVEALQTQLEAIFPDDVIADDRGKVTVGKKVCGDRWLRANLGLKLEIKGKRGPKDRLPLSSGGRQRCP